MLSHLTLQEVLEPKVKIRTKEENSGTKYVNLIDVIRAVKKKNEILWQAIELGDIGEDVLQEFSTTE